MSKEVMIILLVLCVILSAFFSGVEMALAKVNKVRLERQAQNNDKKAKLAFKFVNDYNETITTILIGNDFVNIAASSLATLLFVAINPENGEMMATIIMAIIILVFGEIIPKSFATSYSFALSKILSYPLKFFQILFYPLTKLVQLTLKGFIKLLTKRKKENVTDDELIEMVDTMEEQGLIDEGTQELITNAIDFIDVDAIEIMVHRVDFFAYNIQDDINELLNNPKLFNYSRIPVYDETIDNIIGILNTKKLIKCHISGEKIDVRKLLTEPLYVFQTQSISSILKELRQNHIHMAIVKDEYGGTSGLLTMEDILEELVGEIYDEKDEEEMDEYHKVNKKKFTIDGDMNIFDFFDIIGYDYENNYDSINTTVGGWITDKLGRFPLEKDSFEFEGYKIQVMRAKQFTVERVSVTKLIDDNNEEK